MVLCSLSAGGVAGPWLSPFGKSTGLQKTPLLYGLPSALGLFFFPSDSHYTPVS